VNNKNYEPLHSAVFSSLQYTSLSVTPSFTPTKTTKFTVLQILIFAF